MCLYLNNSSTKLIMLSSVNSPDIVQLPCLLSVVYRSSHKRFMKELIPVYTYKIDNEWGCIWEIERRKRVGLYMGNRTNEASGVVYGK